MVQDTALLDFINEVQMYYTDAQVAATALTSMTSQMREGTIRKCDMASIYTYQNTLYKLQMNGWQLRQFMEWSAAFFKTWEPGDVTIACLLYTSTLSYRSLEISNSSPMPQPSASTTGISLSLP